MPNDIKQGSFIPKKTFDLEPTARKKKKTINVFFLIAMVLFLASIGLAVGSVVYRDSQLTILSDKKNQLTALRSTFNSADVILLKTLDDRIKSAEEILNDHKGLTPLFSLLSELTLETVRFDTFRYEATDGSQTTLVLAGEAESFTSIALQSDALSAHAAIGSPFFTNFSLTQEDRVTFNLVLPIRNDVLLYRNNL